MAQPSKPIVPTAVKTTVTTSAAVEPVETTMVVMAAR
jgi:hypothetical protein